MTVNIIIAQAQGLDLSDGKLRKSPKDTPNKRIFCTKGLFEQLAYGGTGKFFLILYYIIIVNSSAIVTLEELRCLS